MIGSPGVHAVMLWVQKSCPMLWAQSMSFPEEMQISLTCIGKKEQGALCSVKAGGGKTSGPFDCIYL